MGRFSPGNFLRERLGVQRPFVLVMALFIAGIFLYRVPQGLLSALFPNDYVYRLSVAVTVDGNSYTGETISGCRYRRSAMPDWINNPVIGGNHWPGKVWFIGLNVALPDGRFLLVPSRSFCGPTSFRPEPAWKIILGLVTASVPELPTSLDPHRFTLHLFDDERRPRARIDIRTSHGAELLGLKVSSMTIGPASWKDVDDLFARRSGAPWLAPIIESCLQPESQRMCLGGAQSGYIAHRFELDKAMQVPEFAAWAETAKSQIPIATGAPIGAVERRLGTAPGFALIPDRNAQRWMLTDLSHEHLRYLVVVKEWPGDVRKSIICVAPERCVARDRGPFTDWERGEVVRVEYLSGNLRIVSDGDAP